MTPRMVSHTFSKLIPLLSSIRVARISLLLVLLVWIAGLATPALGQGSRLVFSKAPIDATSPVGLTDTFVAGEHIYGLLILDRPLREFAVEESVRHPQLGYGVNRPALSVELRIDGNQLFSGTHYYAWDMENKDTPWDAVPMDRFMYFDVAPAITKVKTYAYSKMHFGMLSSVGRPGNRARAGAQYYAHQISLLKSGSHRIDFKITGKTSVSGSFTITDGNYAFYNELANGLDAAGAQTATMPTAQRKDPVIESSIRSAVKSTGNHDQILRVVITNPDWFVQRGVLNKILFRGIFAAVAFKRSDGTCYFSHPYFKQDYSGGRYGATRQDGTPAKTPIACGNVMK